MNISIQNICTYLQRHTHQIKLPEPLLAPHFPQVSWLSPLMARLSSTSQHSPAIQSLSVDGGFSVTITRPSVNELQPGAEVKLYIMMSFTKLTYNVVVSVETSHNVVAYVHFAMAAHTHLTKVQCLSAMCTRPHTLYDTAQA